MASLVNSINIYGRTDAYTTTIISRKLKRRELFLAHFIRPALYSYQNQNNTLEEKKIHTNMHHEHG